MIVNFHATPAQELPVLAKSILLVEDTPLYQKQITEAINQACPGGLVTLCPTGAQALELLSTTSALCFDLVLVDLGLPDISGVEVIHAARQRFSNVPIMVISTISTESSVIESIRAGARGYILKRDAGIAMSSAIQGVLQGNYPISPSLAHSLFKMAGAPGDAKVIASSAPILRARLRILPWPRPCNWLGAKPTPSSATCTCSSPVSGSKNIAIRMFFALACFTILLIASCVMRKVCSAVNEGKSGAWSSCKFQCSCSPAGANRC